MNGVIGNVLGTGKNFKGCRYAFLFIWKLQVNRVCQKYVLYTSLVWKEGQSFSSVLLKFSHVTVCFIACMGVHFPTVELDNVIKFNTLSSMSGFLWNISKWVCRFGCFLQYTSGLEVLAWSLSSDLNYVTTMLQLHPS